MATIGIIAEYNPFHNGHLYMLEESKHITASDTAISVMSGNFVQRGLPAIADKYTRAHAACVSGIDICFELPVLYATGAAGDFAFGAVNLLNRLGCIDYLCFGAEFDDVSFFETAADILINEPEEYISVLKWYLKKGFPFPAARADALSFILGKSCNDILNLPNNILALEYIKVLKETNSDIKPVIIKRKDAMYHDKNLNGKISSATAIREALLNGADILSSIPSPAYDVLSDFLSDQMLSGEDLMPYICYLLSLIKTCEKNDKSFEDINDMNTDMLNRLLKCPLPASYVDLCEFLKTKNITYSRAARALLHLILKITEADRKKILNSEIIHYANVLSFNKKSSGILREISASGLEVITKNSDYIPCTEAADLMWKQDIFATEIYNTMYFLKTGRKLPNEYRKQKPII